MKTIWNYFCNFFCVSYVLMLIEINSFGRFSSFNFGYNKLRPFVWFGTLWPWVGSLRTPRPSRTPWTWPRIWTSPRLRPRIRSQLWLWAWPSPSWSSRSPSWPPSWSPWSPLWTPPPSPSVPLWIAHNPSPSPWSSLSWISSLI